MPLSLENHKDSQHEPHDFEETSAFDKFIYVKTWKVWGYKSPLITLQAYKAKIRNSVQDYLQTVWCPQWSIRMKATMYKEDEDGNVSNTIEESFRSCGHISLSMGHFDDYYEDFIQTILVDYNQFSANESEWKLYRVDDISIYMNHISGCDISDSESYY